jgi:hypothetical protein
VIDREPLGTYADGYELRVDEEPWAICEDDYRSGGAIVWMLGAIVAALIVVVAWVVLGHE